MKFLSLILILSALTGTAFGCGQDNDGFLPENTMQIPVGAKSAGGLTEAQFNTVISKIEAIYAPVVASRGGKLKIARKWTDATVNANATQFFGSWNVNMYGGLARHEKITMDGFSLVLCHELGHHMGGAPKVGNLLMRWASNEGESDYWATLKCLRTVWWNDNNEVIISKRKIPSALTEACSKAHGDKAERAICIRGGMAGASVAALLKLISQLRTELLFLRQMMLTLISSVVSILISRALSVRKHTLKTFLRKKKFREHVTGQLDRRSVFVRSAGSSQKLSNRF
jgi:hypothetical protein